MGVVRLVPEPRLIERSGEEECLIGVERWAEIRRLHFVEKRSKRPIHRLTGVHRDTITRALISEVPPRYEPASTGSKLDPFKDWMREQLANEESKQRYSQRMVIIEPVFAHTMHNRRIDRFQRRGLAACRAERKRITATHTLLKLWRHGLTPIPG